MSALDRIKSAIALEPVDRAPVFPLLLTAAPRLYGITQAEAWRNHDVCREVLLRCFREYGYDIGSKPNFFYPMLPGRFCTAPVRNLIPGKQLPEDDLYQVEERVLFSRDDYARIAALGWNGFWEEHYPSISKKSLTEMKKMMTVTNELFNADLKICEEQGMPIFIGAYVDSVLMAFSMCRTLTEFTRDLYEVPDQVEVAMKASCDDLIENTIRVCRANGKKVAWIVLERGSGFYYRLEVFERFEWPFLQRYVDAFVSEGITPWLHLDTDWSMNLPYFRQLPKGKCVLDLDSTTDIFQAKEILGGHMCISGDVPAALLALGKPEEVETYCRRLIDEVGAGGGFMLTTGCECPINVRPENLRAMVETGLTYRGKAVKKETAAVEEKEPAEPAVTTEGVIAEAFTRLEFENIRELIDKSLAAGRDVWAILDECQKGMDNVGELYSRGDYFLGELIMSADIFEKVAADLEPLLLQQQGTGVDLGVVVIGTPRGDIHDIGKNIVATVLKASGFKVYDIGIDVPPEKFIAKVEETGARIVAMSALITPTFESMKEVTDLLQARGLREGRFVIIGGGPTTETVRDFIGADAWTLDPKKGAKMCIDFIKNN
jgi:methanogenic corrinoid protein MtbC1/uroporphyrinogen-III decarboxylase